MKCLFNCCTSFRSVSTQYEKEESLSSAQEEILSSAFANFIYFHCEIAPGTYVRRDEFITAARGYMMHNNPAAFRVLQCNCEQLITMFGSWLPIYKEGPVYVGIRIISWPQRPPGAGAAQEYKLSAGVCGTAL